MYIKTVTLLCIWLATNDEKLKGMADILDVHRQRVTARLFFSKLKTKLLNVEFAMNPAGILFED